MVEKDIMDSAALEGEYGLARLFLGKVVSSLSRLLPVFRGTWVLLPLELPSSLGMVCNGCRCGLEGVPVLLLPPLAKGDKNWKPRRRLVL